MPVSLPSFRVLILNTPTLLGDLLAQAMIQDVEFEVIREREFGRTMNGSTAPDIVVVGRALADEEQTASALLARWPQSLVVAIGSDRRGATFYELEPTKLAIGDLAPKELVLAIRSMAVRDWNFRRRKKSAKPKRRGS
jgi:hypothetical protein